MPKAIDPKVWDKIRSTYFANPKETYENLTRFGVSVRAIKSKSREEGDWKVKRDTEARASQALAEEVSEELAKPIPEKSVRVAMKAMSRNEICDTAIAHLYSAAPDAEIKSQEAAYSALIKIVESQQRMEQQEQMFALERRAKEADVILKERQVNPPTEYEWAEYAISQGMSMQALVDALKKVSGYE